MMHCWVPIFMKIIGNNLYKSRNNLSLALETDGKDHMNRVGFDRTIKMECPSPGGDGFAGGYGRLELSLRLSSGKVECRKWVRETNENVIVKKPKMEE
ncbi:hypothetical protein IEQ34_000628 [Dendrobium chrysotoxum]|uniref:Uncharacterized protein n=1 Tax=Dendrobium chrysotoxum TaxID=161865 RepID=A0AAV7HRU8_DENCH|nr:hypothetical protein IEQ34_000628 [Dendrobium chrysotoxum]